MTQNPQWGQQGGYPQPGGGYPQQGGQPPQGQPSWPQQGPGGYAPQGQQPGGYPPQGQQPGGYLPQGGGYQPQGGYGPQPAYGAQGGYRPQGPGGYGPQGPAGPGPGQPPKKKSPLTLILIVVAAVVLVAAIGGIAMALSGRDGDQPSSSITPAQPSAPPSTDEPSTPPSGDPSASGQPSDEPSEPDPSASQGEDQPSGDSVDLGNGIELTPASGWSVEKTGKGVAQLSDGKNIFLGQAIKTSGSTNPGQLCTAWHKQVADGTSGGKFQDPKDIDLNSAKVKGATCLAQVTASSGQGSQEIFLFSLVSVRESDGVTVIGTAYFTESADAEKLNADFETMVNSMLKSQT